MASDHSMDIVVRFDFQELRNAVDQGKREITNRFDLKDHNIEIDLSEEEIKITAPSNIQITSAYDILLKKVIARQLSPLILDPQEIKEIGGMRVRQEIKLIKSLDQENAKKITKIIKENLPKVSTNIQGDTVRASSKSIDDLQAARTLLANEPSIKMPLEFTNYR
ncbi:YajQ family cyclic di-GMP-binding protein [Candidatus Peregrinibacteria bacterium HGW-Peregrinibacteria-1]|jgi:hypothetical protein|nr:MAG: YajQ family cyclic di-GMP-binding protein [Candidatus Peregrinibacteria bacterium HGW-Peregrinibacteria-1]